MRPIIGVSTAWSYETWSKADNVFTPDFFYVGSSYVNVIHQLGGIPYLLPPLVEQNITEEFVEEVLSNLDGLLLTGGGDVGINPGDGYVPYLVDQQKKRYEFEALLVQEAWVRDFPTLGICRGHQMIVEVLGGKITSQPILNHSGKDGKVEWNTLELEPESLLAKICGAETWNVNSYHTQAAEMLPPAFTISARCQSDGVIEAIEAGNKSFFMGMQFHPEKMLNYDKHADSLLRFFIEKAKYRSKDK